MYIDIAEAARILGRPEPEVCQLSSACGGPIPRYGEQYLRADVEAYRSGNLNLARSHGELYASESIFAEAQTAGDSHVIKGVLLCGNRSRNGYEIPESAFGGESNTRKLYEGQPVFSDHAKGKELSRSVRDMGGTIRNVRMLQGKPYGDIDCEGCIAGPALLALARKRTPYVGLSHVASYRWSPDRKMVTRVEQIVSVDVVFRPATTNGFHEQTRTPHDAADDPTPLEFMPGSGRYVVGYGP
jgi:hypothetical protein